MGTEAGRAGADGFQLVSGIRRVEAGRRIEAMAEWTGASGLRPAWYLLEAVAQAAGWLIAASTGFARRGLPLSIGAVRFNREAPLRGKAELSAEVTAWRDGSAVVRGQAAWEGRLLGEAVDGICGLVAAGDLEDPAATRAAYTTLLEAAADGAGGTDTAEPPGVPSLDVLDAREGHATWLVAGGQHRLFANHFPRLPLLPGTLQVQALVDLAGKVAAAGVGPVGPLRGLRRVRFRRPVRPGDRLALVAEVVSRTPERTVLTARTLVDGERATSIGEIAIGPAA